VVKRSIGLLKENLTSVTFAEKTVTGVSSWFPSTIFLHIAHGLCWGKFSRKTQKKEGGWGLERGTEIDAIASLTPISWRHSSLGIVTEWDKRLEGHQVSELDNLAHSSSITKKG
jgi:hypothetical protein